MKKNNVEYFSMYMYFCGVNSGPHNAGPFVP